MLLADFHFSHGPIFGTEYAKKARNTKKRNGLHEQKMNDLVYVMTNMRLTKIT
jgi:hypothetical protein